MSPHNLGGSGNSRLMCCVS